MNRFKFGKVKLGRKEYILDNMYNSFVDITPIHERYNPIPEVREGMYVVSIGQDQNTVLYVLHNGEKYKYMMDKRVYSNDHIWQKHFHEVLAYEFSKYDFVRKVSPDVFKIIDPKIKRLYAAFNTWKTRKNLFLRARLEKKKLIGQWKKEK